MSTNREYETAKKKDAAESLGLERNRRSHGLATNLGNTAAR